METSQKAIGEAQDEPEGDYIATTIDAVLQGLAEAGVGRGNGRSSVLTRRSIRKLLEALERGHFYEPACSYAGISYRTFRRWMTDGEDDSTESTPQFILWQAAKKAEAISEDARLGRLDAAAKASHRNYMADIILLSRRHRERWADQVPQQSTSAPQIAIGIQVQVQQLAPQSSTTHTLSPVPRNEIAGNPQAK